MILGHENVNAVLKDANGNFISSEQDVSGLYHSATAIIQDVITDANNSSVIPLNSGDTFTGVSTSSLGISGIQVSLKADQNATVYIEQSSDDINWDISDPYKFYKAKGNFGITVQATASYLRVRVTNTTSLNMTYMRLQTIHCPTVEALPRTLDEDQLLQTSVSKIVGRMGRVTVSPMGDLKTATPVRLVGTAFNGTTFDTNFWTATPVSSATVAQADSTLTLSTGVTANDGVLVNSIRVARYTGGNPNYFRSVTRLPSVITVTGTNTRRIGPYDPTNGFFFEFYQAQGAGVPTLQLVSRKNSIDAAAITVFNGDYGDSYVLDNNVHTYEVWWTNSKAWFFIDNVLLHILSAATTTAIGTTALKVGLQCFNSGGNTADNTLQVRIASILRLGDLVAQPQSAYQSGTTAGRILKYGTGNLHRVILSTITSGSVVTIYDGTSTGGAIIHSATLTVPPQAANVPIPIDFGGLPFTTGLFLVIATQSCKVTIIYE